MVSDRALRVVLRSDRLVALFGDAVRAILAALVVGAIALWLTYYAALGRLMYTSLHMNDFGKFYYSAQMFLDGREMYGPSPATVFPLSETETIQLWNMNPPHFHLLILPLARLAPSIALGTWAAMNLIALAVSVGIITRELRIRWTPARALWASLAGVAFSATGAVVVTGQLTFLLMLGVTVAWKEARHDRWQRAGAWLGLLASIKPFLLIFGLYMLVAQRRAAVAMAASAVAPFLLGVAVLGFPAHVAWVKVLSLVEWEWLPMNASTAGFLARSLSDNPVFTPLHSVPVRVAPLALIAGLAVVVVSFGVLLRRTRAVTATQDSIADRVFATLLLTASLVSPISWVYYLWLLAGPILGLRRRIHPPRQPFGGILLVPASVGFLCPVLFTTSWQEGTLAGATIGSVYFWMTLSVWLVTLSREQG